MRTALVNPPALDGERVIRERRRMHFARTIARIRRFEPNVVVNTSFPSIGSAAACALLGQGRDAEAAQATFARHEVAEERAIAVRWDSVGAA